MKKLLLLTLIFSMIYIALPAHANEAGGQPGEFLSFGAGARSLGMGKAYVALADEASATYWNQAGLTQIEQPEFTTLYTTLFMDTSYSFLSYAHPTGGLETFGINAVMLNSDNFEKVNASNEAIGTFSDQKMSFGVSYARRLNKDISFGIGLNYLTRTLDTYQDSFITADISTLYTLNPAFSIGAILKNAASSLIDGETNDTFSPELRIGAAYKMLDDDLILSADLSKTGSPANKIHAGMEYKIFGNLIVLRAGADSTELTGGLGLNLDNFVIDYAYAQQEIGDSHRFSFTYKFGATTEQSRKKKAELLKKKAEKAYRAKDYNKANDEIKEALKIYPEGKDEQLLKKKIGRVLSTLKKQKGANPWGDVKLSKQVEQSVKEYLDHDLHLAKDRLEYVLTLNPDHALAQDLLAIVDQTISESGNTEESPIEKRLEKILALFYEGEYSKVIIECKKVIAIDPTIAEAYKKLGSAYYMKRMNEEAIDAWKQAVKLDPSDTKLKSFLNKFVISNSKTRASK